MSLEAFYNASIEYMTNIVWDPFVEGFDAVPETFLQFVSMFIGLGIVVVTSVIAAVCLALIWTEPPKTKR